MSRVNLTDNQAAYLRNLKQTKELADLQYQTAVLAIAKGGDAVDGAVDVRLDAPHPHITIVAPEQATEPVDAPD